MPAWPSWKSSPSTAPTVATAEEASARCALCRWTARRSTAEQVHCALLCGVQHEVELLLRVRAEAVRPREHIAEALVDGVRRLVDVLALHDAPDAHTYGEIALKQLRRAETRDREAERRQRRVGLDRRLRARQRVMGH